MHQADTLDDLELLAESIDLECKKAQGQDGLGELPSSIWESYSAMANTVGGEIYLGVEETKDHRFKVLGIKRPEKIVKAFWDGVRSRKTVSADVLPPNGVEVINHGDINVVRIVVPRADRRARPVYVGENPITGTYVRRHEGDYRLEAEAVKRLMAEAVEDIRDDRVLPGFGLDDLEMESVQSYRNRFSAQKPTSPWVDLSLPDFLRRIGALRKERSTGNEGLTVAGLLMFGRYETITEHFPHYMVDYQERPEPKRELRWIDRLVPDGTWSGNLFDFYQKTLKRLTTDLKVPFALKGATRVDETPIHEALREALTNAIIHADFTGRVSVLIVKRPDMFGFRNPGLMRVSVEQAFIGGISDCRNHRLQDMFRYIGLGDHAGSGVPSILKSWMSQHWRTPLLHEDLEHEQTLLELRTSSLFPQESIDELKKRFGASFTALPELSRIILATALIEGVVTHGRLRSLTVEHPRDISSELMHLVKDGYLEKRGETRAAEYLIPGSHAANFANGEVFSQSSFVSLVDRGSMPDLPSGMPGLPSSMPDLKIILLESLKDMGFKAMPGKMEEDKLRQLILILCSGRWLTAKELGLTLDRDFKNLKSQYLSRMIKERALEYRFPDKEKHPHQAYRTTEPDL